MKESLFVLFGKDLNSHLKRVVGQPSTLLCYTLGLCVQGQAELKINGETSTYRKGDCIYLIPGTSVEVLAHSDKFESRHVKFSANFTHLTARTRSSIICQLLSKKSIYTLAVEHSYLMGKYLDLLQLFVQKYPDNYYKRLEFSLLTESFQIKFYGLLLKQATERYGGDEIEKIKADYALYERFLDHVRVQHEQVRSVDYYAQLEGMTRRTFSARIKHISGHTPKRWINKAILRTIQSLLIETEFSLKEIGLALGFSSASVFNLFFKKQVGVSPIDFRKQHQLQPT